MPPSYKECRERSVTSNTLNIVHSFKILAETKRIVVKVFFFRKKIIIVC